MAQDGKVFGKRQMPGHQPVRSAAAAGSPAEGAGDEAPMGFLEYKLVRQLGGFAAGLGIVIAMFTLYYFTMKQAGHQLAAGFEMVGAPGFDSYFPGDLSVPVATSCLRQAKAMSVTAVISTAGMDPVVIGGEANLARAANYLSCLATQDLAKQCNYPARKTFAAGLKTYVALLKEVRSERNFDKMLTQQPLRDMLENNGTNRLIQSGGRPSDRFDPQLARTIGDLAARGRFATSDFGMFAWFTPAEIQQLITGVAVTRNECT